jgi:hypothetical protein
MADGLVSVTLRSIAGRSWLLNPQKDIQGLRTEGEQRNLERAIAVWEASGIAREHPRRIEPWMSTNGVKQVGRECHV